MHFDHAAIGAMLLRLLVGLFQIPHGAAKLGWLGAGPRSAAHEGFASYGLQPAKKWVFVIGLMQVVLGALLALGLFTGPSAVLTGCMSIAMANVALRPNGWFWQRHGMEYAIFWAGASFAVAELGPGLYAIDNILGF